MTRPGRCSTTCRASHPTPDISRRAAGRDCTTQSRRPRPTPRPRWGPRVAACHFAAAARAPRGAWITKDTKRGERREASRPRIASRARRSTRPTRGIGGSPACPDAHPQPPATPPAGRPRRHPLCRRYALHPPHSPLAGAAPCTRPGAAAPGPRSGGSAP